MTNFTVCMEPESEPPGATLFCLEPEPTQFGLSRNVVESEPPFLAGAGAVD